MPGPNHPSFQNLQRITAAQLNGLLDSTVTRGNPRVGQIAIRGSRLITAANVDLLARLNGGNNSNAAGAGGASREIPAVSVGQNYELAELNALAAQGIRYGRRADMNNLAEGEPILDTNNHLWIWSGSGWLSLRREQPSMAAIANIAQLTGSALSLQLPAASGGSGQFTYALTGAPSWVKRSGRNLSGTFEYRASAWRLKWTATDAVSGLTISRSFSLQSTGTVLAAPSPAASAILNDRLVISWQAIVGASSYQHRRKEAGDSDFGGWTSAGSATKIAVAGLSPGTRYEFEVRAIGIGQFITSAAGVISAMTANRTLDKPLIWQNSAYQTGSSLAPKWTLVVIARADRSSFGNWPENIGFEVQTATTTGSLDSAPWETSRISNNVRRRVANGIHTWTIISTAARSSRQGLIRVRVTAQGYFTSPHSTTIVLPGA
ncbi:MAG: fibronectin type III domain-containing protein [Chloroflexi bacterium]|nr:fibronectin type III domain-containing protein [Chloroflexota bacterium]